MLKTKDAVAKAAENKLASITIQVGKKGKQNLNSLCDYIINNHKIPIGIISDYVHMRKNLLDAPIPILYCIMEAIDIQSDKKIVPLYFDNDEIQALKDYKYSQKKLKFPLKFDVIQITDTQWIGRITVKELMLLAPIIKYNENTQRKLVKKILSGEIETYSIFLNRKALTEITESYQNNSYIPNTITLNIPEEEEFKYENGKLIFKSLDSLDILDGYHRYVAMTNLYSLNNDFDYTMEIRWVNFNEDKAKQFIWQEDQKTKMTKLESNSYNQNNPGNQIITMLNQVTMLNGIIGKNCNINDAVASGFINSIWFNDSKRKYSRAEIIEIKKLIERKMIEVMDFNPNIFDHEWNKKQIGGLFVCISHLDMEHFPEFIELINKEEIPIHTIINKRTITALEKVYREI